MTKEMLGGMIGPMVEEAAVRAAAPLTAIWMTTFRFSQQRMAKTL